MENLLTECKKASGVWYHGTLGSIHQFWPMTHFGSRDAAITAVAQHYFDDQWKGKPQLIALPLSFDGDAQLRRLKDWGGADAIAIAGALVRLYDQDMARYQQIHSELIGVKNSAWNPVSPKDKEAWQVEKRRTKEAVRIHAQHALLPYLVAPEKVTFQSGDR